MQLDDYVQQVQQQLSAAAALGDEHVVRVADTLATAVRPAVHLAVLAAITDATDEITALLLDVPGAPAVSARLDSDAIRLEVTPNSPEAPEPDDGDPSARISLRLSERLKAAIDTAAARDGVSVNTWLVRAASSALTGGSTGWAQQPSGGHRLSGYING